VPSSANTSKACRPSGRSGGAAKEGDEYSSFDWASLVPFYVHPLKVEIIEALDRIGRPLSPALLARILERGLTVSHVTYHVRELQGSKVLKVTKKRRVRGATETFYWFRNPMIRISG
jgi:DNA-binding transcriptional ArsR family regulator